MKIVIRPRGQGKTMGAIKHSHKDRSIIICIHNKEVMRVMMEAKGYNYIIPKPITVWDFLSHYHHYKSYKPGFILDNAEGFFDILNIKTITLTGGNQYDYDSKE